MPLSLLCLALVGAADMFSVFIRNSLIQFHTPDDHAWPGLGAVSSLAISASNELGELQIAGLVAGLIGAIAAVAVGGVGAIFVTAALLALAVS